jgi:hypothetical protein
VQIQINTVAPSLPGEVERQITLPVERHQRAPGLTVTPSRSSACRRLSRSRWDRRLLRPAGGQRAAWRVDCRRNRARKWGQFHGAGGGLPLCSDLRRI